MAENEVPENGSAKGKERELPPHIPSKEVYDAAQAKLTGSDGKPITPSHPEYISHADMVKEYRRGVSKSKQTVSGGATNSQHLENTASDYESAAEKRFGGNLREKLHRRLGVEGNAATWATANGAPVGHPKHEELKSEWMNMPEAAKHAWQNGPGKAATGAAFAEADNKLMASKASEEVQRQNIKDKAAQAVRATARNALFPNEESRKNFKENGVLLREGNVPDEAVSNFDDPRQIAAMGEPRTQRELNWAPIKNSKGKTLVGGAWMADADRGTGDPRIGLALHSDPSHHAALAAHIESLHDQLPKGATRLPLTVKGSTTNHIGENLGLLQNYQFNNRDKEYMGARESLAASAKAHTLGMHDEALAHYNKAVDHAANLADINTERDRSRGATVSPPMEAYIHGDRLLANYRNSIAGKGYAD